MARSNAYLHWLGSPQADKRSILHWSAWRSSKEGIYQWARNKKSIGALQIPLRQNNFSKIAPEKNIFVRLAILFRSNLSTMKKNPYFNRMLLLTVTTNAFVVTLIFSQVINIMNEFGLDRKMIAQVRYFQPGVILTIFIGR
jgi:hypothetical protein